MRTCATLTTAKMMFPNLRVGQLIMDALPEGKDLFYIPDEELAVALEKFMEANAIQYLKRKEEKHNG
jgi:hypothetical protein